jgi:hypothetical protein
MGPQLCRFSDAGNDDLSACSGGRRPKSAKGHEIAAVDGAAAVARALWGFGRGLRRAGDETRQRETDFAS